MKSVIAAADSDTEIIVVDDGSSDGTLRALARYETTDTRVSVFREPHRGQSSARKVGFENASGEWIIFVDSDDTLPRDAIKEYRRLVADDIDIVIGNVARRLHGETTFQYSGEGYTMTPREMSIKVLLRTPLNVLVGKIYRRSVIEQIDWDDDLSLTNQEGAMFMLAITRSMTGNVLVDPSVHTYNYILRSNSQSTTVYLRREGFERMWLKVNQFDLPRTELVEWGLRMIYLLFIERGIPIPKDYLPAKELIRMARGVDLEPSRRRVLKMLRHRQLMRWVMTGRRAKAAGIVSVAPKLSIIIPVYNNVGELKRTIASIFNTSFRNIEIIVVDDGSDDKTRMRLQSLYVHYRRIKLVRHKRNLGVAAARLTGFKAATGEVVMFVDAGDKIVRDGVFDALLKLQSGYDIVGFGMRVFSTTFGFSWRYYMPTKEMTRSIESGDELFDKILSRRDCLPSLCNLLIRRDAISSSDLDFQGVVYGEDMLARLCMHYRRLKVGYVDMVGYMWATGGSSHRAPEAQWALELELARRILGEKKRFSLSDEQRSVVIESLTYNLALGFAGEFVKPWRRAGSIENSIRRCLTGSDDARGVYEMAHAELPDVTEVIEKSRRLAREHRRAFLFKTIFKF
jgi:glycosyltransferase involved in cell wall biosynthesis